MKHSRSYLRQYLRVNQSPAPQSNRRLHSTPVSPIVPVVLLNEAPGSHVGTRAPSSMAALGYFSTSKIRLNGVAAARRNRVNPPASIISRSRASPACAPNAVVP